MRLILFLLCAISLQMVACRFGRLEPSSYVQMIFGEDSRKEPYEIDASTKEGQRLWAMARSSVMLVKKQRFGI
jgi:hypothetical protein